MTISAGLFTVLRPVIPALALVIAAGCAASPPQPATSSPGSHAVANDTAAAAPQRSARTQAPSYAEDETPMSDTRLVESAEFTRSAVQLGLEPEIRNGVVLYCWKSDDLGSRLATKKCVNQMQLQSMLLQGQQQRDAMQQKIQGGCPLSVKNCR